MPIYRSRALTGSPQPRSHGKTLKDPIEHHCSTCNQTYELSRYVRPFVAGTFYPTQGHLQVTCPDGHREEIPTTLHHLE
ncbi:MAG: hypothetical protein WB973_05940 [Thermoanaerobaculia bacterium]